jgi:hypothetical protein
MECSNCKNRKGDISVADKQGTTVLTWRQSPEAGVSGVRQTSMSLVLNARAQGCTEQTTNFMTFETNFMMAGHELRQQSSPSASAACHGHIVTECVGRGEQTRKHPVLVSFN